jgi:hypothetical protein
MVFSFGLIFSIFSKKILQLASFVLKHWKIFLVLGLFGAVYVQHEMIASRNLQITELNGKLITCADANEMLANTLDNRNDEIDQWKEVSDKLQAQNDALVGTISKIRTDTEKVAEEILTGPKPGSCEDSIKYLVDGVKDLKW